MEQCTPLVSASVTVDKKAYRQLYRHAIDRYYLDWLGCVVWLAIIAMNVAGTRKMEEWSFYIFFSGLAVGLFTINLIESLSRAYRPPIINSLHGNKSLFNFFEDHLVIIQGNQRRTEIAYCFYETAIETKTVFLLLAPDAKNTPLNCTVIPKSCLTPEQVTTLRNLFERFFGGRFSAKIKHN